MLNKTFRLHKNRDIIRVLQKGAKVSSEGLRLSFLFNPRSRTPRATVIIGAKSVKKATQRNRFKRQIRAVLQDYIKTIGNVGVDMVVMVFKIDANKAVARDSMVLLEKIKLPSNHRNF